MFLNRLPLAVPDSCGCDVEYVDADGGRHVVRLWGSAVYEFTGRVTVVRVTPIVEEPEPLTFTLTLELPPA